MCFVRFIYLLPWLLHITVREVQMGVFCEIYLLLPWLLHITVREVRMGVFCEIYLFTTLVTTHHSERGTDGCVL